MKGLGGSLSDKEMQNDRLFMPKANPEIPNNPKISFNLGF